MLGKDWRERNVYDVDGRRAETGMIGCQMAVSCRGAMQRLEMYCDGYFKGYTIVPNVKYSTILWTVLDFKVSNDNSISVVKYSVPHTFMTSCLRNGLVVFSLTGLGQRQLWRKNISRENITHCFVFPVAVCILFAFFLCSQFYWQMQQLITA